MTEVIEVRPGLLFDGAKLRAALPTIEVVLFFGKLYKLDAAQLGDLLRITHGTRSVVQALTAEGGEHSNELQDYIIYDLGAQPLVDNGEVLFAEQPPMGEVLPQLWESLEVEIAKSISDVAEKLKDVVGAMPGKEGRMLFRSMMTVNAKRPTIGDHKAAIEHERHPDNLVILDCSGSMSERTIRTIVEDVVALSFAADAHLAIVSDTATHWGPGEFSVEAVLRAAEYCGTHYEVLAPLFDRDWGVVVTIADYDSSHAAKAAFKQAAGRIEQVLDISLVNRPTFLSEVVGILAKDVRPLLVAADDRCCMR